MRLLACETDDCQVIAFTENDAGGTRCPGCGFRGELLRNPNTSRYGLRRFVRVSIGQPGASNEGAGVLR